MSRREEETRTRPPDVAPSFDQPLPPNSDIEPPVVDDFAPKASTKLQTGTLLVILAIVIVAIVMMVIS